MRKIVCGLIISVCLGVNLYADNSKRMWLYTDEYEDIKGPVIFDLFCGAGFKPSKNFPSGYKSFEIVAMGFYEKKNKEKGDLKAEMEHQLKSCASVIEDFINHNKNIKFKKRYYSPKVLEILYNHYKYE
ncbi:hypothetical protein [Helicobacter sp.]|uniref:hypothetical protein n=1 Tax=Helicobacter sp. TaxID=218 RepID=UPI001984E076|nr:hypothetical protein [Helicobacter sp.]MBD5164654.1 hypothetical protein [Helicobacter sp.]